MKWLRYAKEGMIAKISVKRIYHWKVNGGKN